MRKIIIYVITACLFLLHSAFGCYKETEDCHRYIHFTNNSQNDFIINSASEVRSPATILSQHRNILKFLRMRILNYPTVHDICVLNCG